MINLSSIIEQINQAIDGNAFAEFIDYHPDKIQKSGSTLKCFCPVHNELAFRSLIFNLKTNTYKCMMKRCACFDGGNFVEFWSIYKDMEPIQAALDLADQLKLDIDTDTLRKLGTNFQERAEEALQAGNITAAREAIDQAIAMDSHNMALHLISASIFMADGKTDKSLNEHLIVLDAYMKDPQSLVSAQELIVQLEKDFPDNLTLLQRQLNLADMQGDSDLSIQTMTRLAEIHESNDEWPEAIAIYEKLVATDPTNLATLEHLTGLYEANKQTGKLSNVLEMIAELCQQLGDAKKLLAVLNRMLQLTPGDLSLQERIIEAHVELGDKATVQKERLKLFELHLAQGNYEAAQKNLDRMIEISPDSIDLLERKSALLQKSGHSKDAVDILRNLANMAKGVGQIDQVNAYFDKARAIDPNDIDLRTDQAEWKLSNGNAEGGLADLFSLADHCLHHGDTAQGMIILERIATLNPSDIDKRLRIGRCLERNHHQDEAFHAYCKLVEDLLRQGQPDASIAVCEELKRLRPMAGETLELRIQVHLSLNQKSEAIEVCREIAEILIDENKTDEAEEVLLRAVKIDRIETQAKIDLANLYELTGRDDQAAQLWIEMALMHRTEHLLDLANGAIREALRIHPDNREARIMLAEGLEQNGKTDEAQTIWKAIGQAMAEENAESIEALKHLRHAHELAPHDIPLLRQVARMMLTLCPPQEAKPLVSEWLSSYANEDDLENETAAYQLVVDHYPTDLVWRSRFAQLLRDKGEPTAAAEQFELLLAAEQAQAGNPQQRLAFLEQLVTLKPDRLGLRVEFASALAENGRRHEALNQYRSLADHYLNNADLESGVEMLNLALEVEPENRDILFRSAELFDRCGNAEMAVDRYERLAEINRRDTDRSYNLPVLEKLLAYQPDRMDLRVELADIYEIEGDIDQAIDQYYRLAKHYFANEMKIAQCVEMCERIQNLSSEFIPARELAIDSWLKLGHLDRAKDELDSLGDLALTSGELDRAEDYFKRVLEIAPDDVASGERLAKLYEAQGDFRKAGEAFRNVLANYEAAGETHRAINVLQKLKEYEPEDLELRLKLAKLLLSQGVDRREAGEEFLEIIEMAFTSKKAAQAHSIIEEIRPQFTTDWIWRMKLARMLVSMKQRDEAVREWDSLSAAALKAGEFEIARESAGEGLLINSNDTVLREHRIEANRRMSNFEQASRDLRELAERFAGSGQYDRAERYLVIALEMDPAEPNFMQMLAETRLASNKLDDAREVMLQLIDHYNQQSEYDSALQWSQRLTDLFPDDTELLEQKAAILIEADREEQAIEVWRQLAETMAANGDFESAIKRYLRMLDYMPGNIAMLRRLADLSYEVGGMIQAMAYYDRLIDQLSANGQPEELEAEYRRILELEPGHLQLKERMIDFLLEQDRSEDAMDSMLEMAVAYRDEREQYEDAIRIVRRMKRIMPDNLDVLEEEAELLERMGQSDEAYKVLCSVSESHHRAKDLDKAIATLERAGKLAVEMPEAQLKIAALHREADNSEQATACLLKAIDLYDRADNLAPCAGVLRQAIEINPDRTDLQESLARMFERLDAMDQATQEWLAIGAKYEESNHIAEAKRVYKHLRQLMPSEMECRQRLGRLYEAESDRASALKEYRELAALAHEQNTPAIESAYLEHVLILDPNDEASLIALAAIWRAQNDEQNLYDTLMRLVSLYNGGSRLDLAIDTLQELLTLKPDDTELVGRSVDLLIKTGRTDEAARQGIELIQSYFDADEDHMALETLRRITEIDPHNIERRISLAKLVYNNDRQSEALQEFFLSASKLVGDSNFEDALTVCQSGLELFADDVRLRELLGRVLVKLDRHAEAIDVQLHLASLFDERDEISKAQRVYESILADNPDNRATLEAMVEWALRHEKFSLAVEQLIQLSESHYVNGDLPGTIETMERIQKLDPSRLELKVRLGDIYQEHNDIDSACDAWLAAARAFAETGQNESSVELFERVHALRPDDIELLAALTEAYQHTGREEEYETCALELADLYTKRGDTDDAVELLRNLAEAKPNDAQAWQRLVNLYVEMGDVDQQVKAHMRLYDIHKHASRFDAAREQLQVALELLPERADILEELGDLCLTMGRRPEGLEHLARATALHSRTDNYERVRHLASRILKLDPLNFTVRRLLAEVLEHTGETEAAIKEYSQVGRGFTEAHNNAEAIEVISHLLTLAPGRIEDLEMLAKLYRRENRIEESVDRYFDLLDMIGDDDDPRRAIKYCRQILADCPDHPQAHAELCSVYHRAGKLRQAFKECEWLADYYQLKGSRSEAENFIRKGLGWFPEELGMRSRLVDLLLDMDRATEAGQQLKELAHLAEERSDSKTTAWAMAKACEIEPDNLDHQQRLADYLERTGDLAAARDRRMQIIGMMLDRGMMEEACGLAENIIEGVIDDDNLRMQIAEMFEAAGLPEISAFHYHYLARRALNAKDLAAARLLSERTLAIKERHVGARETLIEVLLAQGEKSAALVEYEAVFDIYHDASEWESAQRVMQCIVELAPTRPEPRRKLIDMQRRLRRDEQVVDQLRRLVEIYVNADQLDAAINTLRELMDERPDDTLARVRFIDLYSSIGDESELKDDFIQLARIYTRKGSVIEATQTYDKLLMLHPEDPVAREEFVQFLLDQGQISRAVEETLVLVDLYESAGRDPEAGKALDRTLNYAPDELELRARLADVYMRTNRRGLALETFRTLARHYESQSNWEGLIRITEKIVEIDDLNVEYRQRLADLYLRNGQVHEAGRQSRLVADQYYERGLFDLAETEYRRALDVFPDDPELWHLVIDTHLKIGTMAEVLPDLIILGDRQVAASQLSDAVNTYRRVLDCDPDHLEVLAKYCEIYLQIGLEQDLIDDYLHLADLYMANARIADAIRIYKHLMDISPDNQIVMEKLSMTQSMMGGGKPMPKPAPAPKSPEPAPSGRNSTGNDDNAMHKLIRNYENVLRLNPGNASARMKLAELFEQSGEQTRADEHWVKAASAALEKGETNKCADICEAFLTRKPDDTTMQSIYGKVKRSAQSQNAIDNAIERELENY